MIAITEFQSESLSFTWIYIKLSMSYSSVQLQLWEETQRHCMFTAQLNENDLNQYMKTDLYFRRFGLQRLEDIQKKLSFSFF